MGKQQKKWQILLGSKVTADGDCSHEVKRHLFLGRKAMTNLDSELKNRDITLPMKVHLVKAMFFPVVIYGCESWTIKLSKELMLLDCGAGEDSWESLDSKEIKPVNPKGNQSWIFTERTDAEAETPIIWPPDVKSQLIRKDPDAGKDWRQEETGKTENKMVGWHHWLNGHEFEWTLGVGDGQGGLACCDSWGRKELDMTEQLNWTELNWCPLSQW